MEWETEEKPFIKFSAVEVEFPDRRGAKLFILTGVGFVRLGLAGGLGPCGMKITLTARMILLTLVAFMFK